MVSNPSTIQDNGDANPDEPDNQSEDDYKDTADRQKNQLDSGGGYPEAYSNRTRAAGALFKTAIEAVLYSINNGASPVSQTETRNNRNTSRLPEARSTNTDTRAAEAQLTAAMDVVLNEIEN